MKSLIAKVWIIVCSSLVLSFPMQAWAKVTYPQRIIALAPHIVESLYEIGAGERIVATVDFSDYPEQALDIPRIGGYHGLQMEKILELKPDLIIVWQTGNRTEDIKQLEKLGLPLAYSKTGKLADVAKELLHFGELTGQVKEAELAAKQFTKSLQTIQSTYNSKKAT